MANVTGTAEPIYGPSAIRSVAVQAEEQPYTELNRKDFTWAALDYTNVETQIWYLMADNGHFALAQIIYNNIA